MAERWEGGTRGRKTSEGPDLGWRGWWELRDGRLGRQPDGGGVDRNGTEGKEEVSMGHSVFQGRKED